MKKAKLITERLTVADPFPFEVRISQSKAIYQLTDSSARPLRANEQSKANPAGQPPALR